MKINSNKIEQSQNDLNWKCVDEAFVEHFVTWNFPATRPRFRTLALKIWNKIKFNEVSDTIRIERHWKKMMTLLAFLLCLYLFIYFVFEKKTEIWDLQSLLLNVVFWKRSGERCEEEAEQVKHNFCRNYRAFFSSSIIMYTIRVSLSPKWPRWWNVWFVWCCMKECESFGLYRLFHIDQDYSFCSENCCQ